MNFCEIARVSEVKGQQVYKWGHVHIAPARCRRDPPARAVLQGASQSLISALRACGFAREKIDEQILVGGFNQPIWKILDNKMGWTYLREILGIWGKLGKFLKNLGILIGFLGILILAYEIIPMMVSSWWFQPTRLKNISHARQIGNLPQFSGWIFLKRMKPPSWIWPVFLQVGFWWETNHKFEWLVGWW